MGVVAGKRLPEHSCPSLLRPNVNTYTHRVVLTHKIFRLKYCRANYHCSNQGRLEVANFKLWGCTFPVSMTREEWVGPRDMSTTRCLPSSLRGVASSACCTCSWDLLRMWRRPRKV